MAEDEPENIPNSPGPDELSAEQIEEYERDLAQAQSGYHHQQNETLYNAGEIGGLDETADLPYDAWHHQVQQPPQQLPQHQYNLRRGQTRGAAFTTTATTTAEDEPMEDVSSIATATDGAVDGADDDTDAHMEAPEEYDEESANALQQQQQEQQQQSSTTTEADEKTPVLIPAPWPRSEWTFEWLQPVVAQTQPLTVAERSAYEKSKRVLPTDEQQRVIDRCLDPNRCNVFVDGPCRSGHMWLAQAVARALSKKNRVVMMAAGTPEMATRLRCDTITTLLGLNEPIDPQNKQVSYYVSAFQNADVTVADRLRTIDVLVLVGMEYVSALELGVMDRVFKKLHGVMDFGKAFGPKQLIAFGDVFGYTDLRENDACYQSPLWATLFSLERSYFTLESLALTGGAGAGSEASGMVMTNSTSRRTREAAVKSLRQMKDLRTASSSPSLLSQLREAAVSTANTDEKKRSSSLTRGPSLRSSAVAAAVAEASDGIGSGPAPAPTVLTIRFSHRGVTQSNEQGVQAATHQTAERRTFLAYIRIQNKKEGDSAMQRLREMALSIMWVKEALFLAHGMPVMFAVDDPQWQQDGQSTNTTASGGSGSGSGGGGGGGGTSNDSKDSLSLSQTSASASTVPPRFRAGDIGRIVEFDMKTGMPLVKLLTTTTTTTASDELIEVRPFSWQWSSFAGHIVYDQIPLVPAFGLHIRMLPFVRCQDWPSSSQLQLQLDVRDKEALRHGTWYSILARLPTWGAIRFDGFWTPLSAAGSSSSSRVESKESKSEQQQHSKTSTAAQLLQLEKTAWTASFRALQFSKPNSASGGSSGHRV